MLFTRCDSPKNMVSLVLRVVLRVILRVLRVVTQD